MQQPRGRREVLSAAGAIGLASFSGCLWTEDTDSYRPGTIVVTTERREPTAAELWVTKMDSSPDSRGVTATGTTPTPPQEEPESRTEASPAETRSTETSPQSTPVVLEEIVAVERGSPAVLTGLVGESGSYVVQVRADGEHLITDFEVGSAVGDTYLRVVIEGGSVTSAVHTATSDG